MSSCYRVNKVYKKRRDIILCFICLFTLSIVSCKDQSFRETLMADGIHTISDYVFDPESTLESRISVLSDFALEKLEKLDQRENYQSYTLSVSERKMFINYCELLPPENKSVIKERLVKIYFVRNFIGAGMTDFVLSPDRKVYTLLYINPAVINIGFSKWVTDRENSMLIHESNTDIRIDIDCGKKIYGTYVYAAA